MRHIISILLQNESGALSRVATMFASRGFNIESLNVAPTDDASVSRLTLVTIGTEEVVTQISKQLAKLIDVVAIADRTATDAIERELGLLKFAADPTQKAPLSERILGAGGRILDESPQHLTAEISGTGKELDTFLASLPEEARLLSVVRSGPLVISRGPKALG
jgi:acetolactate synthase-1/3 small subunit